MEIGSVPIQNVATQTFHGELSAIAVTKSDLREWEVEISLVSSKEPRNFCMSYSLHDYILIL
jgi:hypothetical protein